MAIEKLIVPNIGDFNDVEIIEVLIQAGDTVAVEQPLITLESDKATMDVPASLAGVITEVCVKAGERINEGDTLALIDTAAATADTETKPEPTAPAKSETAPLAAETAPDSPDRHARDSGQPKQASMDSTQPNVSDQPTTTNDEAEAPPPPPERATPMPPLVSTSGDHKPYAGPAVRRLARDLGVDLTKVKGSGRKGRIVQDDVHQFVKSALAKNEQASGGFNLPPAPDIDFRAFGEVSIMPLSRINKLSAAHLHRCWLTAPHVTQFADADITDMEEFRQSLAEDAKRGGYKMTPLAFLIKAAVAALRQFPKFNASLANDGESLILKQYFHIGVAVDTPTGLIVPVVKDADQKGLKDIARELADLSARARDGKLKREDLQGGCFTISSLGGIGGSHFTPIINLPEVAILGVSRAQMKPIWDDKQKDFVARRTLPLALSYDHRVIDGAEGARFITHYSALLADIRRLAL